MDGKTKLRNNIAYALLPVIMGYASNCGSVAHEHGQPEEVSENPSGLEKTISSADMQRFAENTELKEVVVKWSMYSTEGVIGYRFRYSDNIDMQGQVWHQDCSEPTYKPNKDHPGTLDFTMYCHDVPLGRNETYFTVSSYLTDKEVPSDVNIIEMQNPGIKGIMIADAAHKSKEI